MGRQDMRNGKFIYLRNRKAIVVHPPHGDRDALEQHLRRIGMLVDVYWPMPITPVEGMEFVFVHSEVGDDLAAVVDQIVGQGTCVTIAVVESESPTIIMKTLSDSIDLVLTRPLRATGLLCALTHALFAKHRSTELSQEAATMRRKLTGIRQVEKAKEFLMEAKKITGDEAYAILRRYSMDERRAIEDVAKGILDTAQMLKQCSG